MSSDVAVEGSPLRQILVKSRDLKGELNLKQGSWWEYTGFDKHARALQQEYATLVEWHGKLKQKIAAAPENLVSAFETLESEMEKLEGTQVNNDTASRNGHQKLVAAQVVIAKDLDGKLDAAAKKAKEERALKEEQDKAAKVLKADQGLMRDLVSKVEAWDKMDVGTQEITGAKLMRGNVNSYKKGVLEEGRPITDGQRKQLNGFDAIDNAYKQAAQTEKKRKDEIARVDKEKQDQAKALKDWADALAKAKAGAKALQDDPEIEEGLEILGKSGELQRQLLKLQKLAQALDAFEPGKPDPEKLGGVVTQVEELGKQMKALAAPAVSTRDAEVAAAIQKLEDGVEKEGQDPRVGDVKKAAAKIPGLVDEIFAAYRAKHFDTEPQQKRRDAQKASKQGEADKFLRVGGWMSECGLGGSPRPGSNGPVFMSAATDTVEGFKTHFSQYQANAAVPPDGLKSKLAAAKAALLGGSSDVMCPHLTQERVQQRGSPDNARLYTSGVFLPGNIPADERDKVKGKMQAQLDRALRTFEDRLKALLE